jgi:CRP-like cAMP-binding protein
VKEFIQSVILRGTRRTFKKGSILLYQGEVPRMAYIITSGDIKVYAINNAGEEQIVTMHGTYDLFPSPWIFKKTTTSLYYYETTSACDLVTLPRDVLLDHMAKPAFLPAIADYLATNYVGLMMRTTALQQSRASEKIMFTLYYLLFRHGRQVRPDHYEIQLPLTHSTIASLVGLTRETTTTELNRLKSDGVLSYEHRIYIVNKSKLERTLGEESFADISL